MEQEKLCINLSKTARVLTRHLYETTFSKKLLQVDTKYPRECQLQMPYAKVCHSPNPGTQSGFTLFCNQETWTFLHLGNLTLGPFIPGLKLTAMEIRSSFALMHLLSMAANFIYCVYPQCSGSLHKKIKTRSNRFHDWVFRLETGY